MSKKAMENGDYIALTYKACPVCGTKDDAQSEILIHKRFGDLSKINHQVTGYGHPCKECQEMMEKGIVLVIVDEEKTTDQSNPWRTGQMLVLKEEGARRMLVGEAGEQVIRKRVGFIDWRVAEQVGIPVDHTNIQP